MIEIRWNRPGLAIVLALTMGIAFAQTATVQDRVTDSSGAVIPGASVTVANVDSGVKQKTGGNW